jgi:hypothetical protein
MSSLMKELLIVSSIILKKAAWSGRKQWKSAWCRNEWRQWCQHDAPMNDNDVIWWQEASKRLGLAKLHISIIWRAPDKINRAKRAANECNNDKLAWKPQELLHDEQYGCEAAYNKSAMTLQVASMPLYKPTWKSQLLNDEQYNMRTAHRWAV